MKQVSETARPANDSTRSYRLQALSTCFEVIQDEANVIPFAAYSPSDTLIFHANAALVNPHVTTTNEDTTVPRVLGDGLSQAFGTFEAAAAPFSLAVTVVGHITSAWSATDHYRGKSADRGPEMWFQGVWFGVERIWRGDLVRLALQRGSLPPRVLASETSSDIPSGVCLQIHSIYLDRARDGEDQGELMVLGGSLIWCLRRRIVLHNRRNPCPRIRLGRLCPPPLRARPSVA